eukprot:sb/3474423/
MPFVFESEEWRSLFWSKNTLDLEDSFHGEASGNAPLAQILLKKLSLCSTHPVTNHQHNETNHRTLSHPHYIDTFSYTHLHHHRQRPQFHYWPIRRSHPSLKRSTCQYMCYIGTSRHHRCHTCTYCTRRGICHQRTPY